MVGLSIQRYKGEQEKRKRKDTKIQRRKDAKG